MAAVRSASLARPQPPPPSSEPKNGGADSNAAKPPGCSRPRSKKPGGGAGGPAAPRSRGPGKRAAARAAPPSYQRPGRPVEQADEFELGSIFNPGSRKQNYNHLLNFSYGSGGGGGVRGRGGGRHLPAPRRGQHYVPRAPERSQYQTAGWQVVVRAGAGVAQDPDHPPAWEEVELVVMRGGAQCPICLGPPTAGKMGHCGHVYCWPCVLHYLALSDDAARPCPICQAPLSRPELVSVLGRATAAAPPTLGMTLMKRQRDGLVPVPASQPFLPSLPGIELLNSPAGQFIKLFRASPAQVVTEVLAREKRELEQQWQLEAGQPEAVFIQEALQLLAEREERTMLQCGYLSTPNLAEPVTPLPDLQTLNTSCNSHQVVDPFAKDKEEEEFQEQDEPEKEEEIVKAEGARPRNSSGESSMSEEGPGQARQPRRVFYFYQASDGQPVFLHGLCVSLLVTEFGSLENCPNFLEGPVLETESGLMTEDTRTRLRYLRHLPLGASYDLAELDLAALVSPATAAQHRTQLEARRKKRNKKERAERERARVIRAEEARQLGWDPTMVRVESAQQGSGQEEGEEFPAVGDRQPDQDSDQSLQQPAISFAKVAKTKKVLLTPEPAPATTGWMCLGQTCPTRPARPDTPEAEGGSELAAPAPVSLGDTLAAALRLSAGTSQGPARGKKGKRGRGVVVGGGAPRPTL